MSVRCDFLYKRRVNAARLSELLARVRDNTITVEAAFEALRNLPFESVAGLARVDHHRHARAGIPEVVYGEGKTAPDIATILLRLAQYGGGALATRVEDAKARVVCEQLAESGTHVEHNALARSIVIPPKSPVSAGRGHIAIASAGTSDRPVAEEAAVTAEFLGHRVERIVDIGVAGLPRLLSQTDNLRAAQVVIAIAGMEGALPTVLAGLIDRPVIAVPTSVGYGVGLGGFVALMGMLVSCAPGVTVVNIDNGFGAAVAAALINRIPPETGDAT